MSLFQTVALMGLVASPAAAFWRLPCADPVVVERLDPIVNPGSVSGHLHTVMGGNAFAMNMDYNTTQTSSCTSCKVKGDMSNYWTPTLYYKHQNGTFEQVNQVGGALVYYLQRKGPQTEKLEAFPEGFRMVAGNPLKRTGGTDFPSQAVSYNCLDYKGPAKPETGGFPNYNCPSGLRSQIFFPSCWDGKNLDSPDHKSHMAYPVQAYNSGSCPPTHPRHFVSIFYEIIWDTNKFKDMWYGGTQPFIWSMGDPTGYGYHGDFLNGWDVDLLQRAVDTCTNDSGRIEDCGVFSLYADKENQQCKKEVSVEEPMDYLEELPGCNPVQNGPGPAVAQTGCGVAPVIGDGGNPVPVSPSAGAPGYPGGDQDDTPSSTAPVAAPPASSTAPIAAPPSPKTTKTKAKAAPATTSPAPATKGQFQQSAPVADAPKSCKGVAPVTVTETIVATVYGTAAQTTSMALNPNYLKKHKRHGAGHANHAF